MPVFEALNVYMTKCPRCNHKLPLLDAIVLDNWRPTVCQNCKLACKATTSSLLIWLSIFIAVSGITLFLISMYAEISKSIAAVVALIYWPITAPLFVKATKFKPMQYWLPQSRIVGYLVYLVLPVSMIALVIYLLVHFNVGM